MKLEKKVYETRAEKQKDFAIGVGIFFGVNFLLVLLLFGANWLIMIVAGSITGDIANSFLMIVNCISYPLAFLVNILVPLYFILTRTWIGIGILATFAVLLILSVLLGIILSVVCFAVLGSSL